MAGYLGKTLSEAKEGMGSTEFLGWVEFLKRKKNEPDLTDLYLKDACWHLYQLRKALDFGKELPNLRYDDVQIQIVYRTVADTVTTPTYDAEASRAAWTGWAIGTQTGNR